MHALITNDTVVRTWPNAPKQAFRRQDTNEWVMNVYLADREQREACGIYKIATPAAPTHDPAVEKIVTTIEQVDGAWTQVHTVTPLDQSELDAIADRAERDTEQAAARQIIADIDTYLALDSPTAAQTRAAVAKLARVAKRLIIDQYGPAD